MDKLQRQVIVIVGSTSSGKTDIAVALARKFDGEIVSADSRQVYRGMDIGTGKELRTYSAQSSVHSSQRAVSYHLIDVVSPRMHFTLAQYQKRAYRAIEDILKRGKMPILVGGTGLYVQAVVDGYILPKAPPNLALRKKFAALSFWELREKLKRLDPGTYNTIDKNNRRRIERALEICIISGLPLSKQRKKHSPPYDFLMLGLALSNKTLHQRIDKRLKERLRQGMIEEVRHLHAQGVSWKRLESFGLEYRYVSRHLQIFQTIKQANLYDRKDLRAMQHAEYKMMIEDLSRAIKDFARRQMTWFKRDKRIVWVRSRKETDQLVRRFLKI